MDLNDDNQLITLDNETGAIFRENIHKKRRNLLANSCTEFISQLNRLTN
ncbi:MAG: SecY-interacting protein Syd [Pontibacterium sp.]